MKWRGFKGKYFIYASTGYCYQFASLGAIILGSLATSGDGSEEGQLRIILTMTSRGPPHIIPTASHFVMTIRYDHTIPPYVQHIRTSTTNARCCCKVDAVMSNSGDGDGVVGSCCICDVPQRRRAKRFVVFWSVLGKGCIIFVFGIFALPLSDVQSFSCACAHRLCSSSAWGFLVRKVLCPKH